MLLILAILVLAAVARLPTNVTQVAEQITTPLIARDILFGNPDKAAVRLSPDGSKLAFLAPVNGVLNVWVGPTDNPAAAQPVTNDTSRGIRTYFWAYTNNHILYLQDENGNENWRVFSVDLTSKQTKDLTPSEGVQAQIQQVSPKFPHEILIGLNDRDPQNHDIYWINIETGEKQLVQENKEGFADFTTDDNYNIRFADRLTPDGGDEMVQTSPKGAWEVFAQIPPEDELTTRTKGFDKTGKTLYMSDSRGRNTAALTAIALESGKETVIAEDPQTDVNDLLVQPTEKAIQAVAFTYDRKHWKILDPTIASDLHYLRTVADGDVDVVSRTLDDQHWIVAYLMDDGPVKYYLYDRKALEGLPLAKMRPVVIKSREGLNLVSYLTLPVWTDPEGTGRPSKPLPMVLFVHGGPWARDDWGYNPYHQWLANRGYAVLSVNFRGSTGFGKAFVNAANKEWGGKMHNDLIDAVQWAVKEGIADSKRVAIMGGSYGGYATLVGMTFTPQTFACGADIAGPSNLFTLLETIPTSMITLFTTRVGDYRTPEGQDLLKQRSPLTYVDRIQRPLLIGQGANDPRVKEGEADQIVNAMEAKKIPVTYLLYPDEGHGFARPENNLSFNAVAEAFLARCLNGARYEPIGEDFRGSSISAPVGASEIPGLVEALPKNKE